MFETIESFFFYNSLFSHILFDSFEQRTNFFSRSNQF